MAQGTVNILVEALILNPFLIAIFGITLSGSDETHPSACTQVKTYPEYSAYGFRKFNDLSAEAVWESPRKSSLGSTEVIFTKESILGRNTPMVLN